MKFNPSANNLEGNINSLKTINAIKMVSLQIKGELSIEVSECRYECYSREYRTGTPLNSDYSHVSDAEIATT